MGIEVGPQIDVALCPAERAEIFAHILGIGGASIIGEQQGDGTIEQAHIGMQAGLLSGFD